MIGMIVVVFVILTGPSGHKIRVVPAQVTAILDAPATPGAKTEIMTVSGANIYVKEPPDEVAEKMEQAK